MILVQTRIVIPVAVTLCYGFLTIRMDEKLKKQAEELFSDLGLNMTTAFITFAKQSVREQKIPFVISRNVPNEITVNAINEIRKIKNDPQEKGI